MASEAGGPLVMVIGDVAVVLVVVELVAEAVVGLTVVVLESASGQQPAYSCFDHYNA